MIIDTHIEDPVMLGQTLLVEVEFQEPNGSLIDVSSATTLELRLHAPRAAARTDNTMTLAPSVSVGAATCQLTTAELTTTGRWRMQGYAVVGADEILSRVITFDVKASL